MNKKTNGRALFWHAARTLPSCPCMLFWFWGHLHCYLHVKIVQVAWLVLSSQNLRGKGDRPHALSTRLWGWKLFPDITAPKPESAGGLNVCLFNWHLGLQNWWSHRKEATVRCDHPFSLLPPRASRAAYPPRCPPLLIPPLCPFLVPLLCFYKTLKIHVIFFFQMYIDPTSIYKVL